VTASLDLVVGDDFTEATARDAAVAALSRALDRLPERFVLAAP
jgi:hypothetical protein